MKLIRDCIFLGVMTVSLFAVGCTSPLRPQNNTVAVVGKVPVIDLPEKPALESLAPDELAEYAKLPESARKKLQSNDKKLKVYAAQMQVAIEDYNTYAVVRNQKSDASVGVKGGK